MEMTQTRGHADRFHFGSWAKSQPRASLGHSAGILHRYIIRVIMTDLWHVCDPSSVVKAQSADSGRTVMVHERADYFIGPESQVAESRKCYF